MVNILRIEAVRDPECGWFWNNWWVGAVIGVETFKGLTSNRATLKLVRDLGLLPAASVLRVSVEDDGYNVVISKKGTGEPLVAIEYGAVPELA
jgi:hypothetical protein